MNNSLGSSFDNGHSIQQPHQIKLHILEYKNEDIHFNN